MFYFKKCCIPLPPLLTMWIDLTACNHTKNAKIAYNFNGIVMSNLFPRRDFFIYYGLFIYFRIGFRGAS